MAQHSIKMLLFGCLYNFYRTKKIPMECCKECGYSFLCSLLASFNDSFRGMDNITRQLDFLNFE